MISNPGANVVGVLPGRNYGTKADRPVIVGAHWDTVAGTPGYNDNGSGSSSLMEIAAAIALAPCHRNEHTVIFVAFDLEESGCYGSLEFIRNFLMPAYLDKGMEIQGVLRILERARSPDLDMQFFLPFLFPFVRCIHFGHSREFRREAEFASRSRSVEDGFT